MLERTWFRWGLIFLGWTSLGLFFASQTYLTYLYASGKAPGRLIVKLSLAEWYVWAALAPFVVWLSRRVTLERKQWLRGILVHLPTSLFLAEVKFMIEVFVRRHVLSVPGTPNMMNHLHPNFLTYWVIVGLTYGYDYYRKYRERELTASRLETQLAQAQLQALRAQLQGACLSGYCPIPFLDETGEAVEGQRVGLPVRSLANPTPLCPFTPLP